jgi:gas vesicle protein
MMDWLKSIAPMLGTALGGPFGALAASFIADKLGVETKTVDAVTKALSDGKMTPEMVVQIKLAEIDFQKFTEANGITLEQLSVENTKDARDMQKVTRSWVPAALAIIITIGYFGILVGMMMDVLKVSDNQALMILIGALSAGFGTVLNFFLGSSHSSQTKDVMLANSTPLK